MVAYSYEINKVIFFYNIKNYFCSLPFSWQAFFYGLLSGLSFAPTRNVVTFCLGVLGILYLVNDHADSFKKCLIFIICFFYGYFFIGLHWIHFCFLSVDLFWAIPLGMIFFPFIFISFTCWIAILLYYAKKTVIYPIVFGVCFWIAEMMIAHLCTGFPWLLSAYTLNDYAMQGGAYLGAYGMSFIVLLWSVQFYKASYIKNVFLIICFCALNIFGYIRLSSNPTEYLQKTIRLLQPNILQKSKMDADKILENFDKQLQLCDPLAKVDVVIWPESSIILPLNQYPFFVKNIQQHLHEKGFAIIGSPFVDSDFLHTSAYIFDKTGHNRAIYHKNHLVPFGEYLPFRSILEKMGFQKVTQGGHDYCPGYDKKNFHILPENPFGILICYEIIFSNKLYEINAQKPSWFINMTNDAWYYYSAGVHQHLQIVRWRAVEEGIPIARSANAGFTCMIDSFGRVVKSIDPNQYGFIDVLLPKATTEDTVYQKIRKFFY